LSWWLIIDSLASTNCVQYKNECVWCCLFLYLILRWEKMADYHVLSLSLWYERKSMTIESRKLVTLWRDRLLIFDDITRKTYRYRYSSKTQTWYYTYKYYSSHWPFFLSLNSYLLHSLHHQMASVQVLGMKSRFLVLEKISKLRMEVLLNFYDHLERFMTRS